MTFDAIDRMVVSTIRSLSIEAIQAANSGHPGLPMGAAPMAYVLWNHVMNVNPKTSRNWTNRDRFVLSAGHGSALLYSLLHLSGYDVSMDDLKNFRQWGSKTPGHPEVNHTDGVEATSGPLGQGIANAVGMVIGSGMVTLIGPAMAMTGYSVWLAYLTAIVMGFFMVFPYIILGGTMRVAGGPYSIVTNLSGVSAGGLVAYTKLVAPILNSSFALALVFFRELQYKQLRLWVSASYLY